MCDGPMKTVLVKRWVPLERWGWLGKGCNWLQMCQWLLLLLLISCSQSLCVVLIFWDETGAVYLPSGSNKAKAWRQWGGSYLWTVVVGWYILVLLVWKYVGVGITGKAKLGV